MEKIREKATELQSLMAGVLKNKLVSLQMDGGSDVSLHKLLVTCLLLDGRLLLHKLFDTQLATLNEEYYKLHVVEVIKGLSNQGCFVAAITVDNESSPNAGIDAAIAILPLPSYN